MKSEIYYFIAGFLARSAISLINRLTWRWRHELAYRAYSASKEVDPRAYCPVCGENPDALLACPDCAGSGVVCGAECAYCEGVGRIPHVHDGDDL